MPSATLRCVSCKERFPREQIIRHSVGNFCSAGCILSYRKEKEEQKRLKQISKIYGAKRSKQKESNPLKTRKRATKEICHKYIRLRDKNELCICCNKPLGDDYHAGHYLESGNNPKARYDEDNIHGQRLHCNKFKGGDSGFYRVNLIKKIGLERVERLEGLKGGAVKRTCEDYKEIESYYKKKLKKL